ncbi:hypothetical protein SAMN05421807_10794, partial [Virgibacillus chiguensis]
VAPFIGAWIEMTAPLMRLFSILSRTFHRVRGLKSYFISKVGSWE